MKQIEELKKAIKLMIKLYRKTFPTGTISSCGNYTMREDGMWWGRCTTTRIEKNKNKV